MKAVKNSFNLMLMGLLLAALCACGGGSPSFDKPSDSSSPAANPIPPASSSVASTATASSNAAAGLSSSSTVPAISEPTGATIYAAQCASCHGNKGQGGGAGGKLNTLEACTTCGNLSQLIAKIDTTMPLGNAASCDLACSQKLAAFIRSEFLGTNDSSASVASSAPSAGASSVTSSVKSSSPVVTSVASSANSSKASAAANSSATNSSAAAVSSTSSKVAASSSSAPFIGDATRGKSLYENATNNCATCHGKDGKSTAFKAIDPTKTVINGLSVAEYINASMPYNKTDATTCVGQCGYDIAAYIGTWVASSSASSLSSSMPSSAANSVASSVKSTSSIASSTASSVTSVAATSSSKISSISSPSSSVAAAVSSSSKSSSSSSSSVSAAILFQENFESTAVNAQPANWDNFLGYNYNTSNTTSGSNYALVDSTKAYSGTKSIHFKGGLAQIVRALPANTRRVYMRAYVNMSKQMGNVKPDDSTSNHEHLMGIKGSQDANNEIRVGQIKGVLGTNEFGGDDIAPTADKWRSGPQMDPNTWYCVETAILGDTTYNEVRMWVNGTLVHSITSDADWQNNKSHGGNWIGDKFKYVMFGYNTYTSSNANTDVWMDDIVVSTQPIGCGTTAGNSSSSSSSSASGTGSSSSSSGFIGNAATGGTIYTAQCATCHGAKGQGPLATIDATKATYLHGIETLSLESYITAYMPQTSPGTCTGQCAADAAAYIRSWVSSSSSSSSNSGNSSSSSSSSSSAATTGLNYGPRTLRVLTKNEFVNSVYDLTGVDIKTLDATSFDTVPSDGIVGGFSNNTMTSINSGMLQSYSIVVGKVVDKLAALNFAGIVDCTGLASDACGSKLMSDFAPKVFRRPVTDAELQVYAPMFTAEYTGGDTSEGIKLALKTLFTSPQFLYRDETGISAAEIANGATEPQYEATGTLIPLWSTYPQTPGYNVGTQPNYNFTGTELFDIAATGTKDSSGNWPTLTISVDGKQVASVKIDASYEKHYKLLISGVTGQYKYFNFVSSNGGNPSTLVISSANLSGAKKVEIFSPVVMDSDSYMLDQYQLASFLSFTFTGSTPDSTLLAAAAASQLQTSAQVSAQVERLIATPKAKAHFGNFAAQWLRTDRVLDVIKDPTVFPKFTPDVRVAMAQEIREYYTHVVLDEGEAFTKLFDGNFTFVNAALADFYGITGITGTNMRKVTGVSTRAGLVTAGAYLASNDHNLETAPILRAVNLRRQFLCHDVPPPPTGISLNGENVDALREAARVAWEAYLAAHNNKAPSRLKYEFQTSAALCQTCHKDMINPLGGGMEDFDAVGLPQTLDYNQLQINAVGSLIGITSISDSQHIDFTGAKQLAQSIATLDVTRQCFIDNNFRLATGTSATYFDHDKKAIVLSAAEQASYTSEEKRLEDIMKANNNSTKALLKGIGAMDSVRYRKNIQR